MVTCVFVPNFSLYQSLNFCQKLISTKDGLTSEQRQKPFGSDCSLQPKYSNFWRNIQSSSQLYLLTPWHDVWRVCNAVKQEAGFLLNREDWQRKSSLTLTGAAEQINAVWHCCFSGSKVFILCLIREWGEENMAAVQHAATEWLNLTIATGQNWTLKTDREINKVL